MFPLPFFFYIKKNHSEFNFSHFYSLQRYELHSPQSSLTSNVCNFCSAACLLNCKDSNKGSRYCLLSVFVLPLTTFTFSSFTSRIFYGDFKGIRIEDQNEVLWGFRKAPVSGVRGFEQDLGTVLQQGGWIRKTF